MLCSEHFSDECFEVESKLVAKYGMKKTKRLKADAVPNFYQAFGDEWNPQRAPPCSNSSISVESSSKKRKDYEKHENYRLCTTAQLNYLLQYT